MTIVDPTRTRVCLGGTWVESAMRVARNGQWNGEPDPPPQATAVREVFTDVVPEAYVGPAYDYEVITITDGVPEKRYGGDVDFLGLTGSALKPVREHLVDIYDRYHYDIIANADGWQEGAMPNPDEVHGMHVKKGVALHNDPIGRWGQDSLGFRADGTAAIWSHRFGDTVTDMVADGVVTSFGGLGPGVVFDGVPYDMEAEPLWDIWNTDYNARQILGVNADLQIVLITVTGDGPTGQGVRGNEHGLLALRHGCVNAIMLDGGGSAQTMVNGVLVHPSADLGGMRQVAGFFVCRAQIA